MAIAYLRVSSISRGKGKSAVAAAAYRAGLKLKDHLDGHTKDYSSKSQEVVYHEIFLPPSAAEKHHDAEQLWNDVQRAEVRKSPNAQYAKQIEIALPREFSLEESIEAQKKFINPFVERGYGVQVNIHFKVGNPHAHILITARPYAKDGSFDMRAKQKKDFVYLTDEQGNKITDKNPDGSTKIDKHGNPLYRRVPLLDDNGNQRFLYRPGKGKQALWRTRTVKANYLDDPKNIPTWKTKWETTINPKLAEKGFDTISFVLYDQVDRQGLHNNKQLVPQIHLGPEAHALLQQGIGTGISNTYQNIQQHNDKCISNLHTDFQHWYNPKWCPNLSNFDTTYLKKNYIALLTKRLDYLSTLPDDKIDKYAASEYLHIVKSIKAKLIKQLKQLEKYQNLYAKIYGSQKQLNFIIKDYAYRGKLRRLQKYRWKYEALKEKLQWVSANKISEREKLLLDMYESNLEIITEKITTYKKNNSSIIAKRIKHASSRLSNYYFKAVERKNANQKVLTTLKASLTSVEILEKNIISKKITTLPETLVLQLQLLYQNTEHVEQYALTKFDVPEVKDQQNNLIKTVGKIDKSSNIERT